MAETDGSDAVDLKAFLADAAPLIERLTFGSGEAAFTVDLRRVDKRDLSQLFLSTRKRVNTKSGTRDEPDVPKFRKGLAALVLDGWQELTLRKVCLLTNHDPAVLNGTDQPVDFTQANAVELMETARGNIDGEPTPFEDWLLEQASTVADRTAAAGTVGKAD